MKKLITQIQISLIVVACTSWVAHAQEVQIISYPGSDFTQVFGINDRGDILGVADGNSFIYDRKSGGVTDIPVPAGYDQISILANTDSGILAGSVTNIAANKTSGVVLDKKGRAHIFDHPDSANTTQARGISNQGLVTGYFDVVDNPVVFLQGFIYNTKDGSFETIVPSLFTLAQGINQQGEIVGSAIYLPQDDPCQQNQSGTVRYGWVRSPDGDVIHFDVNGLRTSARGINDNGTIVGFVTDPLSGVTKGFVTAKPEQGCQSITIAEESLYDIEDSGNTFLQGIRNSGEMVGTYSVGVDSFGFVVDPRK